MTVSFSAIPATFKVPLVNIEIDPSQAGTPTEPRDALLTDYKIAAGTAVADAIVAVGDQLTADTLFGAGSPLARMFKKFFNINRGTPIRCLPITPPSSGTAATGTVSVSAAPTAAGTLAFYIAGQKISVGVSASDTTANVATKINTAIGLVADLPVTCSVSTSTLTLTSKWKGITGNDIRVEDSILGPNGGEVLPTGLAFTYPANNILSGGAGVPDWTAAIAAVGDSPFEYVGLGHTDSNSLAVWGAEYGFADSGRWGWLRASYGVIFSALRGTYSALIAAGPNNNYPTISAMSVDKLSPSPIWEWVGSYTGRAAQGLNADPARPLQSLTLAGIIPAPYSSRFSKTEANALAQVGLAIQMTLADNVPVIMREQTMYQKNSLAVADNAYELVTTMTTLATVLRRLKQVATNRYPRHKLANDGTPVAPGQAIVTPKDIKAMIALEYLELQREGLVENEKLFRTNLVCERSTIDPNRVDVLFPPDLINQLRNLSILAQFRLQYPVAA
jgi:phage tail sheath gpL-like